MFKQKIQNLISFLRTFLSRILLFWRGPGGLPIFLERYAAQGVAIIPEHERSAFPSYQKCQTCSLCTFSCEAIQTGRAPSSFEPKFIMLGYGRSSHDSEFFLEEWLPCVECASCTVNCPNEVPLHAMAEMVRERRNRIGFRAGKVESYH